MELKIEPTTELSIKIADKKVGRLESLDIDISNSASFLVAVPKVSLTIAINAKAFDNEKQLKELIDKVGKFKFLKVKLYK